MQPSSQHGMWSSRLAFVLAATGSAVGLGNIWRFPYMTSDNGGGAFVLIYLACIAAVGLPILMSEIMIGRHGRMSPVNAIEKVSRENSAAPAWKGIGWLGLVAGIVILSFYSVVAGWTLHYAWLYLAQLFFGAPAITAPVETFEALHASPWVLTGWHGVFMVLTVLVVAMGVEKGLERAVKLLMPALLILLLVLAGYGATTGYMGQAASFLFRPDFSEVTGGVVLQAMGQAFFSLSLGMCAMMTYGAYLPNGISIPRIGGIVVLADTGVALLAGLAVFPIVISFGLDPAGGGAGMIFTSLPLAFEAMPFGIVYGLLFFGLLSVAAWTSSISLLEPATAYLVERTPLSRRAVALLVALVCWALGLASVLSLNVWSEVRILDRDIMSFLEFIANDLMLPLGGMLIALFAGWFMSRRISRAELDFSDTGYTIWLWLVRVVSPALVLVVLLSALW